MAVNPVEIISASRKRIAQVAAIKEIAFILAPALTAMVLAAALTAIGAATWERMGYLLAPSTMAATRIGLVAAAAIVLIAGALRGWRAYHAADNFVGAAAKIDLKIDAHEQVVTLATLADPAAGDALKAQRSALFPILWRNVMNALGSFNPQTEFTLDVREPLQRSSLAAAAIAVALGLAMLALVEPPSPLQKTAISLRQIANRLEQSAKSPEDHQLAESVKQAAADLLNPKLPPKEKLKEIDAVLKEVDKHEQQAGKQNGQAAGASGSGSGNSASQSAAGEAQGSGSGKGQSKGEGKGGKGQNQGGANKQGEKKGATDTVELKNQLNQAQAQVQTDEQTPDQSGAKPSPNEKAGNAPQPGADPNKRGGNAQNENQKGSAPMPVPQQQANAGKKSPKGGGKQPQNGGSMGDTHLGEFPAPANYQRFLKPGENGAALNIKDARYVVFKIPSATPSGGGGKTVIDTERPKASTPYTNAPLAQTADTALPDERQMVPPRYRDLIR